MLKTKILSLGLHLLDEQVDRLQESANQMSLFTGHDIDQIESMILRLLMPEQPPLREGVYRIEWIDADTLRLRETQMGKSPVHEAMEYIARYESLMATVFGIPPVKFQSVTQCPVCHGAKTIVKAGYTEDCAACDATGVC